MNSNFIKKLETDKYYIGSFDAYQDNSKQLIMENSNLSIEETEEIMKSLPTTYRASIIDKKTNNYIGYISVYEYEAQNQSTSIRFETSDSLLEEEIKEILDEYKKWIKESLNLISIKEYCYFSKDKQQYETNIVESKTNIIIPSNMIEKGITEETIEYFNEEYNIPKMQMPCTIKSSGQVIGIIGLTNLIWSNKRANLNIFLDKKLGEDVIGELPNIIIDEYLNFVHNSNIHNVTLSVTGSDTNLQKIIENTSMNYYGEIPFSSINENDLESKLMYQHIPNMEKVNGIYIPENKKISLSTLEIDKKELDPIIKINDQYELVSPNVLDTNNIDNILDGHIEAMQARQEFTIPLGEDKYILQKGNGNYGISKAFMNYSYILVDDKKDYCGYINILRNNAENKNAEIEIGISPKLQQKGLGTQVINKFYEELFSIGYASVTSAVFDFNNPSIKLHEKVAELNGIRLESYYINGKMWNMNFYSKINESISSRHI